MKGGLVERTLFECPEHPTEWVVTEIDMEDEGQIYQTAFTGPSSEKRAISYAEWREAVSRMERLHEEFAEWTRDREE